MKYFSISILARAGTMPTTALQGSHYAHALLGNIGWLISRFIGFSGSRAGAEDTLHLFTEALFTAADESKYLKISLFPQ